jgi:hypothetical protein
VLQEVERAIVGKRHVMELILSGILADGHVLLEDYPGLAKTLIARSFAQSMNLAFARVQFTPDLIPSDITGSSIYNQQTGKFQMWRGPIFTNVLLGDEINRSPPKTQSALQERQVTIEGKTAQLPHPFLVLAQIHGNQRLELAWIVGPAARAAVAHPYIERSTSDGGTLAARNAGYTPASVPTNAAAPTAPTKPYQGIATSHPSTVLNPTAATTPAAAPMTPPMLLSRTDSPKN